MNIKILHISSYFLAGLLACWACACTEKPGYEVDIPTEEEKTDPEEQEVPWRDNVTTYYIDSANGNDRNDGKSEGKAWKTLSKVKNLTLLAGDNVLLRCGSTFNEMFVVSKAAGSAKQQVTISTYGTGDKPKIVAPDGSQQAVQLVNCTYITVENLDVTNHGTNAEMRDRMGFNVHLDNYGKAFNTILKGIDIHDVNGKIWKGEGAGVALRFTINNKNVFNIWDGIRIEGCTIRRCSRNGIGFSGNYVRDNWYPHKNVVIRENLIEEIPGDGIVVGECDGALVEYNVVRNCTDPWGDQHNAAAGIWPWSADNTIIQFNEVSGQKATWDAQGFDADYNCLGTIIRYNYSHDNDGGFLLICDDGTARKNYSAGNGGTKVYGNVSYNDGIRAKKRAKDQKWFSPLIHISGPVEDCEVYHNVLCRGKRTEGVPNQDLRFLNSDSWSGYPVKAEIKDNLFFSEEQNAKFEPSGKDGVVFSGNWYMGMSAAAAATALDKETKGANASFQQLLDKGGSTQKALMDGFLREVKTATATIITVDKDKLDKFFN